jgi:hypothetical protein
VKAEFIWGSDEAHYSEHRYLISAYVVKSSVVPYGTFYQLEDQFMTARKYDSQSGADLLALERSEILTRLKRVKAAVK